MEVGSSVVVMTSGQNFKLIDALLQELHEKLRDLVDTGCSSTIDLRRLPLAPSEYDQLQRFLGKGELIIDFNALGDSRIVETKYHGVWWITHMNAAGDRVGDFLEIALVPEIVVTTREDVASATELLSEQLRDVGLTSPAGNSTDPG